MKFFGIVNITEDSFSDGRKFLDTQAAIAQAIHLHKNGADVIDLGAASSNINSSTVSAEIEINRLRPVISALKQENIPISVDTFNPEVQKFCITQNVDFINDIQGFPYPEIYPLLATANCSLILMHSVQHYGRATTVAIDPEEVWDKILAFFEKRISELTENGIERSRLILDPGMGFFLGSNPQASMLVLQRIPQLKAAFGLPVLIGISRKRFLQNLTPPLTTVEAEKMAISYGANFIRTHEILHQLS